MCNFHLSLINNQGRRWQQLAWLPEFTVQCLTGGKKNSKGLLSLWIDGVSLTQWVSAVIPHWPCGRQGLGRCTVSSMARNSNPSSNSSHAYFVFLFVWSWNLSLGACKWHRQIYLLKFAHLLKGFTCFFPLDSFTTNNRLIRNTTKCRMLCAPEIAVSKYRTFLILRDAGLSDSTIITADWGLFCSLCSGLCFYDYYFMLPV